MRAAASIGRALLPDVRDGGDSAAKNPRYWGSVLRIVAKQFGSVNNRHTTRTLPAGIDRSAERTRKQSRAFSRATLYLA